MNQYNKQLCKQSTQTDIHEAGGSMCLSLFMFVTLKLLFKLIPGRQQDDGEDDGDDDDDDDDDGDDDGQANKKRREKTHMLTTCDTQHDDYRQWRVPHGPNIIKIKQ